ncbi:PP2C family protein-serine/threonine phosphatase [Streptomyces sp. enrichment culture]|uniref:PP2C family protein-serine/threonine phosphatase n=1 Tax=Streptomyces sp. enrichment culture TaxID=1795815 RepID=UPI0034748716
MRSYATAQHTGTRSDQCDATAVFTHASGARAYALLDGIGSTPLIQTWTRRAARQVARAAARRADAEAGLRAVYDLYAASPERQDPYERGYMPSAAAVVAVHLPGKPLSVAWCGDSRAYLLERGITRRLTEDHNMRRVHPQTALYPAGNRNVITSYLGGTASDEQALEEIGHPAIESATVQLTGPARLLLASDGAYEPHEDAGHDLYAELDEDDLRAVVRDFVDLAVTTSREVLTADSPYGPSADNATALLADLRP